MRIFQQPSLTSHLHLPRLRSPATVAASPLQEIWAASQDADDPTSRPRDGWWSISDWASTIHPQTMNGQAIGFAAVNIGDIDSMAEGRLALVSDQRTRSAATSLLNAAIGPPGPAELNDFGS